MGGLRARLLGRDQFDSLDSIDPTLARDYYHCILDALDSAVLTVDRELRITGVNRLWDALALAHGGAFAGSARIVGTPFLSLFAGPRLEHWARACQQILDGDSARYLDEISRDGDVAWRHYSLSATPLKNRRGEVQGIIVVATDISQLKKAEMEMLERITQVQGLGQVVRIAGGQFDWYAFYKQVTADVAHLFDAEKCAIFRWDMSKGYLQPQAPAYGLEDVDKFDMPLDMGDPAEDDSLWQELEQGDYILLNEEAHGADREGDAGPSAPPLAAMMGVLRVSGRIYGTILVVGRDHPFSRQEGQLLATFAVPIVLAIEDAEIYQRLREHRRQLLLARDKLERASQVGERMRRPLAVIQGYLGLLLDGAMGEVQGRHVATLRMLSDKAKELSALVNQLLPSQPLLAAEYFEPVRLADLVGRALELQRASLQEAELHVITRLPPPDADECIAIGNPELLLAVFCALVGRAAQSSPHGGSIHVSLSEVDETSCFRIDDQGPDIPAGELMHIWQSEERPAGADSIALATVKQVVDDHGGQVWAESVRGQGNTFYVVLPRFPEG